MPGASAIYVENIAFLVIIDPETGQNETRIHGMPNDPFAIGMLLVDVARTYARSFQDVDDACTSEEYLRRIKEGFDAEWDDPSTQVKMRKEIY